MFASIYQQFQSFSQFIHNTATHTLTHQQSAQQDGKIRISEKNLHKLHQTYPQHFSYDVFDYDTTTYRTTRNTFATTTKAWNDYDNNSKGKDAYEKNFSQFSGHEDSRPTSGSSSSSTGNSRDIYNNPLNGNSNREAYNPNSGNSNRETNYNTPKSTSTNSNQGRDIYKQPKETSTYSYGFVAESLANSGNSFNKYSPPTTQRPYNQQTTSSTYDYNYNRRTTITPSTFRPNRDTNFGATTRKSTYFQGDLPFLNNDETGTSVKCLKYFQIF